MGTEVTPANPVAVFAGTRPTVAGDRVTERHGIAPIPDNDRYGSTRRNFTVWFAPNLELSSIFTGTLAFTLGLGIWPGIVAIVVGVVLGALPVAYLATWGPVTGTGQLPLARLPFGRSVRLPAAVQWLSAVAWDGLVGLFGGEAAALLFHVPFTVGVLGVLALEGAIGYLGYEFIHRVQAWGSVVLGMLFILLSVRILQHGHIPVRDTVHGGAAVGAFVLVTTIAFSGSFSWASYAADYTRYQPASTAASSVFGWTFAGLSVSYVWMYTVGLAGARTLSNQTAAGVRSLMGGGFLGALALIATVVGAVASNTMNDYSGSLAMQTAGVRVRRNRSALAGTAVAFVVIVWIHGGDTSSRFQNALLFSAYWLAPFVAVVLIDWHRRRGTIDRATLLTLLHLDQLGSGWPALVALVLGFGAMVPFMNTGLVVGPVAKALDGADLSFPVGFVIGGLVYLVCTRADTHLIRRRRGRRRGGGGRAAAPR